MSIDHSSCDRCVIPWKMVPSEVRCGPHPRHGAARRNTPRARTPPTPATTAAQRRTPTWPTKWWPWETIWWKDVEGCKKHVQGRNWMGKETSEMKWMGSLNSWDWGDSISWEIPKREGLYQEKKLRDKPAKHLSESWTWHFLVTGNDTSGIATFTYNTCSDHRFMCRGFISTC